MARFFIVEHHPLFREALESAVRLVDPAADVLDATAIERALDMLDAHRDFDLILLDRTLPGTTGFYGLLRLRAAHPSGVRRRICPPLPLAGEGWGEGFRSTHRPERSPSSGASRHLLPHAGDGNARLEINDSDH